MTPATCCVPGCGKACEPYRALCKGHQTRKARGKDLTPPLRRYHRRITPRPEAA